jgi:hypothetical protein
MRSLVITKGRRERDSGERGEQEDVGGKREGRDIKTETDIIGPEHPNPVLQLGRAETEAEPSFWRVAEVDIKVPELAQRLG